MTPSLCSSRWIKWVHWSRWVVCLYQRFWRPEYRGEGGYHPLAKCLLLVQKCSERRIASQAERTKLQSSQNSPFSSSPPPSPPPLQSRQCHRSANRSTPLYFVCYVLFNLFSCYLLSLWWILLWSVGRRKQSGRRSAFSAYRNTGMVQRAEGKGSLHTVSPLSYVLRYLSVLNTVPFFLLVRRVHNGHIGQQAIFCAPPRDREPCNYLFLVE